MGNNVSINLGTKEIKVIHDGQGRKIKARTNLTWSELERKLCYMYSLSPPLCARYQDSDGTSMFIDSSSDLRFFLKDKSSHRIDIFQQNEPSLPPSATRVEGVTTELNWHSYHTAVDTKPTDSQSLKSRPKTLAGLPYDNIQFDPYQDLSSPSSHKKLAGIRKMYSCTLNKETLDPLLHLLYDQQKSGVEINWESAESTLRQLARVDSCPSLALPSLSDSVYSMDPTGPLASLSLHSLLSAKADGYPTELSCPDSTTTDRADPHLSLLSFNIPPPPENSPPCPPINERRQPESRVFNDRRQSESRVFNIVAKMQAFKA